MTMTMAIAIPLIRLYEQVGRVLEHPEDQEEPA